MEKKMNHDGQSVAESINVAAATSNEKTHADFVFEGESRVRANMERIAEAEKITRIGGYMQFDCGCMYKNLGSVIDGLINLNFKVTSVSDPGNKGTFIVCSNMPSEVFDNLADYYEIYVGHMLYI